MSVIYWEQMLRTDCAYVSICTTETCLSPFSSISNCNGVPFDYQFLSVQPSTSPLLLQNSPSRGTFLCQWGVQWSFPWKSGMQAWQWHCWKGQWRQNPSGVHHLGTTFAHFSEILKEQVLRLMATENLPLANKGKKIWKNNYCWIFASERI